MTAVDVTPTANFTGYPEGVETAFRVGVKRSVPGDYIVEAQLVEKGLIEPLASDKKPAKTQAKQDAAD